MVKGVAVYHVVHVVPFPPGVRPLMGTDDQPQPILLQKGLQGRAMQSLAAAGSHEEMQTGIAWTAADNSPKKATRCKARHCHSCSAAVLLWKHAVRPVHRQMLHACGWAKQHEPRLTLVMSGPKMSPTPRLSLAKRPGALAGSDQRTSVAVLEAPSPAQRWRARWGRAHREAVATRRRQQGS